MFDERSIDDEIAGFITKHRIDILENNNSDSNNNKVNYNDISEILPDDASEFQDTLYNFIPSYDKLCKLLSNNGFKLFPIEPDQIDQERGYLIFVNNIANIDFLLFYCHRTISAFAVDAWVDSLLGAVSELIERQQESKSVIKETANVSMKESLSVEVLMTRITDLQEKLYDSDKKLKSLEIEKKNLGNFGLIILNVYVWLHINAI